MEGAGAGKLPLWQQRAPEGLCALALVAWLQEEAPELLTQAEGAGVLLQVVAATIADAVLARGAVLPPTAAAGFETECQ